MLFQDFMKRYKIGNSYPAPNGTYQGECVSLVKCYINDVLGTKPQSIGNAKYYWINRSCDYIKSLFTPVEKGLPKRGDLFIRDSGTYGHIGIVISANEKDFKAFEQNYNGCRVVKEITHKYSKDIHFLRPKDRKNVVYVPAFKNGAYVLTDNRGLYKGWGTSTGEIKVKDLTPDGKAHATKKTGRAILKKGTAVTIQHTKRLSSGNIWAKIPSGYMCIWHWKDGKYFVKDRG